MRMNARQGITLASLLALASCEASNPDLPNPNFKPNIDPGLNIVYHLENIDSNFEPEGETRLEGQYNIQILGAPELLTPISLGHIERALDMMYDPNQIAGVTFIFGYDGLKGNWGGSYHTNWKGYYGPTIFVANPNSPQSTITAHEIMHHLHLSQPHNVLDEFNRRWKAIPTQIPNENGELEDVTTGEAINKLEHAGLGELKFDSPHLEPVFDLGLFGFFYPYGIGSRDSNNKRNAEDVATVGEPLLDFTNFKSHDRIAYWDPFFSIDPYLAKLDLIEKYRLVNPSAIQTVRDHLVHWTDYFAQIRNYEEFADKINNIPDPSFCPIKKLFLDDDAGDIFYQCPSSVELYVEISPRFSEQNHDRSIRVNAWGISEISPIASFRYDSSTSDLIGGSARFDAVFLQGDDKNPDVMLERRLDDSAWEMEILHHVQDLERNP